MACQKGRKKGRNIAFKITWTSIKKETIENNLYQRIDPWSEDILICPIQNPNDALQRIFLIFVPKSKQPPHMANSTYYIRLNFQTQPLGHEQVSNIFRQYYLQRYDLVNTVYGPIYNELVSYLNQDEITKWNIEKYERIFRERRFLLDQDADLCDEVDDFYQKVSKWNKALDLAPFRLTKIINHLASNFFKKPLFETPDHSAVRFEIKAESAHQIWHIDRAVLNRKDPLDFWKKDYPYDRILDSKILLEHTEGVMPGSFTTMIITPEQFKTFMKKLQKEVEKDEIIQYVWKEFDDLQSNIEILLDELANRM